MTGKHRMITRRIALGLAAAASLTPGPARTQAQVGLAERRAMAAYRQNKWPMIEGAIRQAAGFDVPIDVAWDHLTIPGDTAHYVEDTFFGKTIFSRWSPRCATSPWTR